MATIRKGKSIQENNQFVLALTDDLEQHGLITTRQNYRVAGGRLFQVTARGIEAAERGQPLPTAASSKWTGLTDVSESKREEIKVLVQQIRLDVEKEISNNRKRANALALVDAVEALVDAPDPAWPEIIRLLRNPTIQGIGMIASLVIGIISIVMAA
jgi:DNA-binding PadR family transcriptional regulator